MRLHLRGGRLLDPSTRRDGPGEVLIVDGELAGFQAASLIDGHGAGQLGVGASDVEIGADQGEAGVVGDAAEEARAVDQRPGGVDAERGRDRLEPAAEAEPAGQPVPALVPREHPRDRAQLDLVLGARSLLAERPHLALSVARRNPYLDVLSHAQIELLRRLRALPPEHPDVDRLVTAVFTTISGLAAGLQTAG